MEKESVFQMPHSKDKGKERVLVISGEMLREGSGRWREGASRAEVEFCGKISSKVQDRMLTAGSKGTMCCGLSSVTNYGL